MPAKSCCPNCNRVVYAHKGLGREPVSGDISVCWGCRSPSIFMDQVGDVVFLRKPTEKELKMIHSLPDYKHLIGVMAESYEPEEALKLWGVVE